jgi:hypothetical protein
MTAPSIGVHDFPRMIGNRDLPGIRAGRQIRCGFPAPLARISRLRPVKPLLFVIFQLVVIVVAGVAHIRRDPSPIYRMLWVAAFCGVIGLDVWYLKDFAYPVGFKL